MHGSFEDQAGVPDTFLAKLSPPIQARQVSAWRQLFSQKEKEPDIVHLNHLTPMHQAAFDLWNHAAIITHLHGTEIKIIQTIRDTPGLKYGVQWIDDMKSSAARSRRILTISPHDRELAIDLLEIPPDRVTTIPNGVDVEIFRPRQLSDDERLSNWKQWLVTDPQGWKPGHNPGSIKYSDDDLRMFRDVDGVRPPILLYVGRFTVFGMRRHTSRSIPNTEDQHFTGCTARNLGRVPAGMGGGAPVRGRKTPGNQRRILRRLARPRRPPPGPSLGRHLRRPQRQRTLRPGIPGDNILRPTSNRHQNRRPPILRKRRPQPPKRLASRASRPILTSSSNGSSNRIKNRTRGTRPQRPQPRNPRVLLGQDQRCGLAGVRGGVEGRVTLCPGGAHRSSGRQLPLPYVWLVGSWRTGDGWGGS